MIIILGSLFLISTIMIYSMHLMTYFTNFFVYFLGQMPLLIVMIVLNCTSFYDIGWEVFFIVLGNTTIFWGEEVASDDPFIFWNEHGFSHLDTDYLALLNHFGHVLAKDFHS